MALRAVLCGFEIFMSKILFLRALLCGLEIFMSKILSLRALLCGFEIIYEQNTLSKGTALWI